MTAYQADIPETFAALFKTFASEIDQENARRERLVKASRDVTQASKKLIFALHRIPSTRTTTTTTTTATIIPQQDEQHQRQQQRALAAARADLELVRKTIATRIAAEILDSDGYEKFLHAFSPGIQEHVEAAAMLFYLETGRLVSLDHLNNSLAAACLAANIPFAMHVDPGDYVLGVADVTGELMRVAIGAAADRDLLHQLFQVRGFLQTLLPCFEDLLVLKQRHTSTLSRDLPGKVAVFRESLAKVERACFDVMTRREEFCERRKRHAADTAAIEGGREDDLGPDGTHGEGRSRPGYASGLGGAGGTEGSFRSRDEGTRTYGVGDRNDGPVAAMEGGDSRLYAAGPGHERDDLDELDTVPHAKRQRLGSSRA